MPTTQQENSFATSVIPSSLLDDAIIWISTNLGPGDVFQEDDLEEWAVNNGFVHDEE